MKSIAALTLDLFLLSCDNQQKNSDHLDLSPKLSGSWKASAFSGELHETWTMGTDGWMQQQGYYIEQNDTSYSAKTKIEKVGNTVILFSVIKDSNPKIFKAVTIAENVLVFENKDYKNPFQVHYEFIDNNNYTRTITGYEQDSLVSYKFEFQKERN